VYVDEWMNGTIKSEVTCIEKGYLFLRASKSSLGVIKYGNVIMKSCIYSISQEKQTLKLVELVE
jgi:hypothetical protein